MKASPTPPKAKPAAAPETSGDDSLLLKNVTDGLRETPFSAVVQHLGSKVEQLNDGESKVVYQVRVIESIRGPQLKALEYSAVVEKGDKTGFPKEPVILALCKDQNGYYWPGIGAEFPSTKQTRAFVTKLRPELSAEQKDFEFCD